MTVVGQTQLTTRGKIFLYVQSVGEKIRREKLACLHDWNIRISLSYSTG